jgi:hypothetical protein
MADLTRRDATNYAAARGERKLESSDACRYESGSGLQTLNARITILDAPPP